MILSYRFLTVGAALLLPVVTLAQDRLMGATHALHSPVYAERGMVASSQPLAAQVGLQVLKDGGNAIDAAIATNAALGLMEPTGCGIGGDVFAIIWHAESAQLYGFNGSGRSAQGMTLEWLLEQGYEKIPADGPLPVTVPGTVDGWFQMHDRFGKMKMADILQPAIDYADRGFPLSPLIGRGMNRTLQYFHSKGFPNLEETYQANGYWPDQGKMYRNPMLADTYRLLAKKGRDAYYNGPIAATIASFIQEQGGFLSEEDFAQHQGEWVEPVSVNYRGYDVWELPPNGQGIAALQMLNILKQFDFSDIDFGSPEHVHLFVEAKKLAYEDRAKYYADPDFAATPLDWLLSEDYAKERAALISMNRAGVPAAGEDLTEGETIYLTTADSEGNMVSFIQSNFRGMGSGMVPPDLGFMLQDRGEFFALDSTHMNGYAPGKRPFHTIIPAFITKDGEPLCSFGVMGGDMQPQGHVQIVMNMVDFGMGLQEAGDAPRIRHVGSSSPIGQEQEGSGEVKLETGFPYATIRALLMKRHKVGYNYAGYGGYEAIMKSPEGFYIGATESRYDGQAAGY